MLVVGELATAVVLLVGGGLLLRTLLAVESADRGYRAERVLTMLVDPLGSRYPTPESLLQFYEAVEHEIAAVPGVGDVAWTSRLPLTAGETRDTSFEIVGAPPASESQRPRADRQVVSPAYFRAIDLPLVAGRGFDDRDTASRPSVCVVNETLVRSHLPGREPIGVRLALRPASTPRAEPRTCEIVGVARHVRGRADEREDFAPIYLSFTQFPNDDIYLAVRTLNEAAALAPAVRAAIARIDREQLVSVRDVMTLEDVASTATERHRFRALLVATFAIVALTLAMVGVFGIVGYAVQQRMREVAVRRALGATSSDVLRLVARSIVPVFAAGLVAGTLAAAALGRVVATMLYGVEALDPLTFVASGGVLALAGALAIAGPAWRAIRVEPAVALRGL
jgi:putative ABC transport system permease protein